MGVSYKPTITEGIEMLETDVLVFTHFYNDAQNHLEDLEDQKPGSVFCLLLGVSSDYAQPITSQVTDVTCLVIGRAPSELTPSKRQKVGPVLIRNKGIENPEGLTNSQIAVILQWPMS